MQLQSSTEAILTRTFPETFRGGVSLTSMRYRSQKGSGEHWSHIAGRKRTFVKYDALPTNLFFGALKASQRLSYFKKNQRNRMMMDSSAVRDCCTASKGTITLALTWGLLRIVILVVSLRLHLRLEPHYKIGWDDYIVVASLVSALIRPCRTTNCTHNSPLD